MSSYGFLRQPRWLALGFLVLIVVPSFILLSRWQLHRLDERRHQNSVVETNSTATPVPVGTVMVPGAAADSIGDDEDWKQVTATGRYDVAHQVLVRKRPLDGANGYWVVTPLVTDSGTVLAVNRGWLEAKEGATAEVTDVPAPPAGEVTVVGRVRPSEEAPKPQPSDLPAGQVTDLDVSLVANGSPVYPGYVDLVSSEPLICSCVTPRASSPCRAASVSLLRSEGPPRGRVGVSRARRIPCAHLPEVGDLRRQVHPHTA